MKVELKETIMLDGNKVFDVNVFANSNSRYGHKAIFTCESEAAALAFFAGLKALVEKHTVEKLKVTMFKKGG